MEADAAVHRQATGRTAYQGQFNNQIGIFGVRCDPEKKTIDLIVQNDTVTLKFTDKPLPPPSAGRAQAGQAAAGGQAARALRDVDPQVLPAGLAVDGMTTIIASRRRRDAEASVTR